MTSEQKKKVSGIAIASLICGCFFLLPLLGIISSLAALILGIASLVIISRNKETVKGSGLAIGGIVLGCVGILILPIMLSITLPLIADFGARADEAAELSTVNKIKDGIYSYYLQYEEYPTRLDNADIGACTINNSCFDKVLDQDKVMKGWEKISDTEYIGPTTYQYDYDPLIGKFD